MSVVSFGDLHSNMCICSHSICLLCPQVVAHPEGVGRVLLGASRSLCLCSECCGRRLPACSGLHRSLAAPAHGLADHGVLTRESLHKVPPAVRGGLGAPARVGVYLGFMGLCSISCSHLLVAYRCSYLVQLAPFHDPTYIVPSCGDSECLVGWLGFRTAFNTTVGGNSTGGSALGVAIPQSSAQPQRLLSFLSPHLFVQLTALLEFNACRWSTLAEFKAVDLALFPPVQDCGSVKWQVVEMIRRLCTRTTERYGIYVASMVCVCCANHHANALHMVYVALVLLLPKTARPTGFGAFRWLMGMTVVLFLTFGRYLITLNVPPVGTPPERPIDWDEYLTCGMQLWIGVFNTNRNCSTSSCSPSPTLSPTLSQSRSPPRSPPISTSPDPQVQALRLWHRPRDHRRRASPHSLHRLRPLSRARGRI